MTVSGKRAGVEFDQVIQTPAVSEQEATLAALVIAPFYQIIPAIVAGSANPDARARNADGDALLYDGVRLIGADDPTTVTGRLTVNFWTDPVARTGPVGLPTLIPNSLLIPNTRTLGAVAQDPTYFRVILNPPGTDEFYELRGPGSGATDEFDIVVNAAPPAVAGETIGIILKPGITRNGIPFSSTYRANVLIGMRALRRDYCRVPLRVRSSDLATIAGGTYGDENPAVFSLQNIFEVAPKNMAYCIAVDEVTDGEPQGTYDSFLRALDVAATIEVYTVFIPTYQASVLNALKAHVLAMSQASGRKERIGIVGRDLPLTSANQVLVSGVGDLNAVAPVANIGNGTTDEYHVFFETAQRGATLNTNAEVVIGAGVGAGPAVITYAGKKILASYVGDATIVPGSIATVATDPTLVPGLAVGDSFRFHALDTQIVSVVSSDAVGQTLKHATRNFSLLGVRPGTQIYIDDGSLPGNRRFQVTRLLTDTTEWDTIEVTPVGHTDLLVTTLTGVTYDATIDTVIKKITATKVTITAVFDFTAAIDAVYVDSTKINVTVDLAGLTNFDSWSLVDLVNTDLDAGVLMTAYVGSAAVRGVGVPAGTSTFAGGSDSFLQFYTNSDLANLALAPTKYLDLATENRDAAIASIRAFNGSVVVTDPGGSNPSLTEAKIAEAFSIYEPGAALTITTPLGTEPDLQAQADTLAAFPPKFGTRKIRAIWPDLATKTVNGVQIQVPGYYLGSTLAGLISVLPPEQGHSELPFPGWDSVAHSNRYFKETQLEELTAAGWWVYVQDVDGGPIVCRKQYTTDVSGGDITAEASFTTIADNFQKDVRAATRGITGVNNMTPAIVDRARLACNSVGARYLNRLALKSYVLNSLTPSTTPGDLTTLIGDFTLGFYGPLNLLRIRVNL